MTAVDSLARLRAVVYTLPKLGRSPTENEDSAAVDVSLGRFAVADGASTSARAEVWSRVLVDAFVRESLTPHSPHALRQLRDRWWSLVASGTLPWYAQAKLLQGGAAAFVGLELAPAEQTFVATAVGDSCVFHLRRGKLLLSVPVERSEEFSRFALTVTTRHEDGPAKCLIRTGDYRMGDTFVLATDAIAKFLLARDEAHHDLAVVDTLAGARTDFVRRIVRYRRAGLLANDDTTLCVVRT